MRRIAVIVCTSNTARVAEALRAALGLCLRGDRVEVVLTRAALPALSDARAGRALATLAELGQHIVKPCPAAIAGSGEAPDPAPDPAEDHAAMALAVRRADAIEVWT